MATQSLADLVAVVHLAAVLFMLTGAVLSLRWPRFLWAHVPVAGAILAVNLAGAACPLTELEKALRRASGEVPYGGGFLGHYLVEPVHPPGVTPGVSLTIYVIAATPNVLAYLALATRRVMAR